MRLNRFLENAYRGNESPIAQVAAIGVTWLIFLVIGGSILLIPVLVLQIQDPTAAAAYLSDPTNFKLLKLDMIVVFVLVMCQFLVGLLGLLITERLFLKKKFLWIATGFRKFRFRRSLSAMGLWMLLMAFYQVTTFALDPSSVTFTLDLKRFLIFLPIALILVPLQSAFEELAIRGQLMHGLIKLSPERPYLPLLVSSLIFALLHGMNKEVQEYGATLMMAHYLTFGLVLGAFAIIDEGLEISIGMHAGNNVFSLCLVSYPGASINTPALLQQNSMTAALDYVVMIAFVVVAYLVFFGKRDRAWRSLLANISTNPSIPEDSTDAVSNQE